MCGSDSMRGDGEGNRRNVLAVHGTWPFTPVKTRSRQHGTLNEISKWRCRSLPAAGRWTEWGGGDRCLLLQLHSGDWTALWCLLLQRLTVRHRIVSLYQLTTLSTVSKQAAQTLTVCTLFCFRLSYEYFHIGISGPKFDIRISGYQLTTLLTWPKNVGKQSC